ncbi:biopolymer transporter ExbD [Massilia sp. TS11]|uniref:ExbD/TolR family protein n=1 Tax=Massilia sp. TS11 TaxID=2908003 RepID=UPI001EDC65E5|nr:biopolymer transporter ExbD [Massilia sp. TS11]MCG2585549.1 biopolymer transporter ExbD [Massilia sp. TS11]
MDFRRGRQREEPEINLIPFIDVLLVILIFLMVTTTYSRYAELHITLPTAEANKAAERPNEITVTVDAKGNYTINGQPVSFQSPAGLAEDLRRAAPAGRRDSPVLIIHADQLAMHQMVVNVMEAARLAGFEKLTFAAQTATAR